MITPQEQARKLAVAMRLQNRTYVGAISSAIICSVLSQDEAKLTENNEERTKYWDDVIETLKTKYYEDLEY